MSIKLKFSYFMWAALFLVALLDIMIHLHNSLTGVPKICKSNQAMYNMLGKNFTLQKTECIVGKPCEYPEEVDLRIIIMTYNRDVSLLKLLQSLSKLEMDGDIAALEIWIDKSKKEEVHLKTLHVAESFNWLNGLKRVHIQDKHAGIYGQWIDTWRPKPHTNEIALFLEDDLSVSPYTWRWLKAVNREYKYNRDCFGYTLQSERLINARSQAPFKRPAGDMVFFYKLVGSWGFSPIASVWAEFQDWFHKVQQDKSFHPYVDGLVMTSWYKKFETQKTADSMWTMWFIYYVNLKNLYGVYNNINQVTASKTKSLCVHREEPGLHYHGKGRKDAEKALLTNWSDKYISFPYHVKKYGFDGKAT